jgi:hypothetical protein
MGMLRLAGRYVKVVSVDEKIEHLFREYYHTVVYIFVPDGVGHEDS